MEVYDAHAAEYRRQREAHDAARAARWAAPLPAGAWRLDLGCGPGLYAPHLGRPLVAGDPAFGMLRVTRAAAPDVAVVGLEAGALPFRPASLAGVWAWKCLQHVAAVELPLALAEIQRALPVGGRLAVALFAGDGELVTGEDDAFPGRHFTLWQPDGFAELLVGAGFDVDAIDVDDRNDLLTADCARARTLPDVVGPGMRLLVCGLNPSLYAADVGVAYGRPGNRFWPAALAAGLVAVDRDPWHALRHHGVGFTDLVKRATVGAAELAAQEFRAGLARVERLCELLRPAAVAFCGVTGWRLATGDRRARLGWQDRTVGGAAAYVLPNPSGLNAHTTVADVTAHLRRALRRRPG